ncbi:MAG: HD domain-containing protein [Steroidobacteraceae bacterium]
MKLEIPLPAQLKGDIDSLAASGPPALSFAATQVAALVYSLTEDRDLTVAALLAHQLRSEIPQRDATVTPTQLRLARELAALGEIGLPAGWSPADGVDRAQSEAVRRMLLAVVSDPRLVIARLAQQLVRLRDARDASAAERNRLASEATAVFAPLANRLGVWRLKWELEDYSLRYLEPESYAAIAGALNETRRERERFIADACQQLQAALVLQGLDVEVYGRPKHIYSIYRKMQRKQLPIEQLYDLRALRIICTDVAQCYAALGVVHGLWRYLPGEFDDYIATPKENGYQSIHTAVIGSDNRPMEVQIRTAQMQASAELGIAAHWRYKEGTKSASYDAKIAWVRQLLEPGALGGGSDELLEQLRGELFQDRVFAMTPRGDVIDLPSGATPLDFAYHVHTDLGHRCRGAKINGRIAPLNQRVENGAVVEILAGKELRPSRDWLKPEAGYLVSPRSRAKLRAWFRSHDPGLAIGAEDDDLTTAASPANTRVRHNGIRARKSMPRRSGQRIVVADDPDLPWSLARCCSAIPPEPIRGYLTIDRGVTIHAASCRSLERMLRRSPQRELKAAWNSAATGTSAVTLLLSANDGPGLLRDLDGVLAARDVAMESLVRRRAAAGEEASLELTVRVVDQQQLQALIGALGTLKTVTQVRHQRSHMARR